MMVTNYHGSIINAGDFLIQESAKLFLENLFSLGTVRELNRHSVANDAAARLALYFGGPFISRSLFDGTIPMQEHKVVPVGVGVFDKAANWGEQTKKYFSRISELFPTGRDHQAAEMLKECGCRNAVLGGCPAFIVGDLRGIPSFRKFDRIVVSDPSWGVNYGHAYSLVKTIQQLFPSTPITFCFHRGIFDLKHKSFKASLAAKLLDSLLKMKGVEVINIAGGTTGFKVYDNALHIGFRVHAHVYARSIDRPSVLFTEDVRSIGMNGLFGDNLIAPSEIKKSDLASIVSREMKKFNAYGSLRRELFQVTEGAIRNNLNAL